MFTTTILLIVILFLIYYIYKKYVLDNRDEFSISDNIQLQSELDGNYYYVQGDHENIDEAANTFAIINDRITKVINYIYDNYRNSSNPNERQIASRLMDRYDQDSLRESSPLNSENDTSFTINKGDIVAICIRSPLEHNEILSINTIMFVVLHEISHIAATSYDHPDEFWEIFKWVLLKAKEAKLFTSPDYGKNSVAYCGMNINYNPMYDPLVKDL
jgi:hypothetical protein